MTSSAPWKKNSAMIQMPDVNTLVAAAWPNHVHHRTARAWFRNSMSDGWATCAIVQSGFLRISMNPAVVGRRVPFPEAAGILSRFTAGTEHVLWRSEAVPEEWPAWLRDRVQGYRQITDAFLIATAIKHGGMLATLDARALALLPESQRSVVHVIGPSN